MFLISRSLLVAVVMVGSLGPVAAQNSAQVEQEAPEYSYSSKRPDYLHFKEVQITRVSRNKLFIEIFLRGDFPSELPPTRGFRYKIYFDLNDLDHENHEKVVDDFKSDLTISIYQNPGRHSYRAWASKVQYRKRNYEIEITKLKLAADRLSFEAECPLFKIASGMRFIASSGILRRPEGKPISDNTVQDTTVFAVPLDGDATVSKFAP